MIAKTCQCRQAELISAERRTAALHLNANYHTGAERAKIHRFQFFGPWVFATDINEDGIEFNFHLLQLFNMP